MNMVLQILCVPLGFVVVFGFSALCWWFTPYERDLRRSQKANRR